MKTLGIITLFLLAIIISVGVSVYVNQQRFQLVFGEIFHESIEPSDEPDISTVKKKPELVCFKFDTMTGKTWRFVSEFYKDPNQIVTTLGFEQVYDDSSPWDIHNVTIREKPQKVFDLQPMNNNEAKKKSLLDDFPLKDHSTKKKGGIFDDLKKPKDN